MIQTELFGDDWHRARSADKSSDESTSVSDFKEMAIALAIEDLKTLPAFWETDANAKNTWDMLIHLWPDNEPGMGMWDEIQSLVRSWIASALEKQPRDELRQLWEDMTLPGGEFEFERYEAEEKGEEAIYPGVEEICADLAFPLLDEVLGKAESEGDRRREEEWERE